nr:immunoglobulin light chain junction region [Macaca mulatta]
CQQHDNSPSTF